MSGHRKKISKNKKGFVFTASIVFFVITILSFSIIYYKNTEENEKTLITDSTMLRIINLEDSIQQSIKRIFMNEYNLTIASNKFENYEELNISTTISNDSSQSRKLINSSFDDLFQTLKYFYPENYLNTSSLKEDPRIYTKTNLIITKDNLDNVNDRHENLTLFFNESGSNYIDFKNITISISSTDDYEHISNVTENPTGNKYNLTIEAIDTDGVSPINTERNKNITIPFDITNDVYSWVINNSENTTTYTNITLTNESLSIISNYGTANIELNYKYKKTNISKIIYHPAEEIIKIEIPNYKIQKKGNFISSYE
jgi:hypothetical protein